DGAVAVVQVRVADQHDLAVRLQGQASAGVEFVGKFGYAAVTEGRVAAAVRVVAASLRDAGGHDSSIGSQSQRRNRGVGDASMVAEARIHAAVRVVADQSGCAADHELAVGLDPDTVGAADRNAAADLAACAEAGVETAVGVVAGQGI